MRSLLWQLRAAPPYLAHLNSEKDEVSKISFLVNFFFMSLWSIILHIKFFHIKSVFSRLVTISLETTIHFLRESFYKLVTSELLSLFSKFLKHVSHSPASILPSYLGVSSLHHHYFLHFLTKCVKWMLLTGTPFSYSLDLIHIRIQ